MRAHGIQFFLTGSSGFLGRHVLGALSRNAGIGVAGSPWCLIAGSRTRPRPFTVEGFPRPVEWQPLDLGGDVRLRRGIDVVIHVAGEKQDVARMMEVNSHGTRRLVEAAASAGVRRFVYVSSVGSYGAPPNAGDVDEAFPHTPRTLYESSKDAGEMHVRRVCMESGMQAAILQPANVIGHVPGKSMPLLGLFRMIALNRFAWIGKGDPIVNYVGVGNVAEAIVAASTSSTAGTYIVNTPCRLVDLVRWVADELHIDAPARRLPEWIGRTLASAGGLAMSLTGRSMPFGTERLLELTNTTRYVPDAFLRETGFVYPLGIEQFIRQLAREYISEELL